MASPESVGLAMSPYALTTPHHDVTMVTGVLGNRVEEILIGHCYGGVWMRAQPDTSDS